MAKRKSNWDKIKGLRPTDTTRYRDVYESQQLDRTHLQRKQDMTSRNVANIAMTIFMSFVFYIIFSIFSVFSSAINNSAGMSLGEIVAKGFSFSLGKIFWTIVFSVVFYYIMRLILKHNLDAQNQSRDMSDINQYHNDQHIALPAEIQRKFDWFPDVGATSDVQVSSMISHIALSNKGLSSVMITKRSDHDILDDDGTVITHKGDVMYDENGDMILEEKPMIDIKFMHKLFDASGLPRSQELRKFYDTTQIEYNPYGSNRDKLGKFKTVADLINSDWQLPYYEPQRPGGAYLVDTAPVNTLVLAITRAGKGQGIIEPTIDMWSRERRSNNCVINDPKGELLVKFYVPLTVRGFQVVQFNLINAMKTDIYNPLGLAADAAREGDFTKCALYVENIADVFFPLEGGDDPVWPNAANNAFKRAAYGLIDYYLEEEKELRRKASKPETYKDEQTLETEIDQMWGKVTLYNAYQLFVQLTSKKEVNVYNEFEAKLAEDAARNEEAISKNKPVDRSTLNFPDMNEATCARTRERLMEQSELIWDNEPEADRLTLYFNALDALPMNSMRRLVSNANNALKSMAGADKMMAS